jgi:hypothetical protein
MSYWFRRYRVLKYNENHDEHGRFAAGAGSKDLGVSPAKNLNEGDRAIETRMTATVQNYDKAVSDYSKLKDSKGGTVLNTDTARELSQDYMKDRTKAAAVHEPASQFIKTLYADKLKEEPTGDKLPLVLFTAGGTGAGKSTAIEQVPEMKALADHAQIIYDTNMNTYDSALSKINQALDANKAVHITMVQRDPTEALVNGALTRAERQAQEHGSGRTVPLAEHVKTHVGASQVIERLAEHFKNDQRVQFDLIDNSNGRGGARLAPMSELKHYDKDSTTTSVRKALESEHENGKISDATYRGFKDY